jgi:hypothetical protein
VDSNQHIEFLWRRLEEPPELFGMALDFHPLWWLAIALPLLVLALALVYSIYVRESRSVGWQWGLLLAALRTLAILSLFVIWLLPATRVVESTKQKSRVVMLFDVSASMTQMSDEPPSDIPGQVRRTRQEQVLDMLHASAGSQAPGADGTGVKGDFLAKLLETNPLVCYRFGEQLDPNSWMLTPQQLLTPEAWADKLQPSLRPRLADPVPSDMAEELGRAAESYRQTSDLEGEARDRRRKELVGALERALTEQRQIRERLLNRTNLGVALRDVLRKESRNRVQGLILVSDGHANAGSDQELAEAVKLAQDNKIPIFTIGVGQGQDLPNLRLVDVLAPGHVQPEDEFPVRVVVEGENVAKQQKATVVLSIEKPGLAAEEQTREVVLNPTTGKLSNGTVEYRIANPQKLKGDWKFRARVLPLKGERSRADNKSEEPAIVKVEERKPSVLLVAAAAGHDYQFLRTLLIREQEKFDLTICLQNATQGTVQDVDPKKLLDQFPTELRAQDEDPNNLAKYDVIVAFDPDWRQLLGKPDEPAKINPQENLRKWVDQFGGGLIVIAGAVHTFTLARHKDLGIVRELYPVILDDTASSFTVMDRPSTLPWALNWGPNAPQQPYLDLMDTNDPAKTLLGWEEFFDVPRSPETNQADMPSKRGFYSFFPLKDVKPAASVIARFSDPDRRFLTPRGERQPYFVLQKVGKGSVFYIGSPEMWRLRWNEIYHERFWTKLIRHFSKRETPRGLLVVGSRYAEGDYVVVEAQLFDAELKPLKIEGDAKVLLRVLPPENVGDAPKEWVEGMPMKADPGKPGWYSLRFAVRRAGKYGLELKFPGSNEKLTGRFRVDATDPERDDTKPNFALLHRLASEAKDVQLHDEQQRKAFTEALNKVKETVRAEAKEAPPGVTVLTAENQTDRLLFDTTSARWIGECLESNDTPFRTEGKVTDLWDKGWTVFADIEHADKASGPPWALVLLVLLLSAEWLTRKLLKLA